MWFKLVILLSVSLIVIAYGVLSFRKSFDSEERYDFKEDFKRTFLTLHWKYSGFFNDGRSGRIVPVIMILGGIGIVVVGLIKLLG